MKNTRRTRTFAATGLLALLGAVGANRADAGFVPTDITVTMTGSPNPVAAGAQLTYTIKPVDNGPDNGFNLAIDDPLPAGVTFTSLGIASGWTCTTPAVGSTGPVHCSIPTFTLGTTPSFTLVVTVAPGTPAGTMLSNTVTISALNDSTPGNNSATVSTTAPVDLQSFNVD
ncbi:hypothetical protein [Dokdonella soli]|uniref:DUF11 domain-containing protein n=1 Tax=Dokdonella soli TaxID=529810 RepID=A0ABN1ILU7_9GAMM